MVSESVGLTDGTFVGESVETGAFEGGFVGSSIVGSSDGISVGGSVREFVGNSVMGASVDSVMGASVVGILVGSLVERMVSESVGLIDGAFVGETVETGAFEGGCEGTSDDNSVLEVSLVGTIVGTLLRGRVGKLFALLVGASVGESVETRAFEG
jgi:hypothetical protein